MTWQGAGLRERSEILEPRRCTKSRRIANIANNIKKHCDFLLVSIHPLNTHHGAFYNVRYNSQQYLVCGYVWGVRVMQRTEAYPARSSGLIPIGSNWQPP
jgi:hypothetical protein